MRNDQAEMDQEELVANIALTASLSGGKVVITGPTAPVTLPKKSGAHPFNFTLTDNTGMHVHFLPAPGFLAVSETGECPPQSNGITTDQIEGVHSTATTAHFIDKNKGPERTLGYALYFGCDDPKQTPCFDPIIINGGD